MSKIRNFKISLVLVSTFTIYGCAQKDFDGSQAIQGPSTLKNKDKVTDFYTDVKNNKNNSKVEIINITEEGEEILNKVNYRNKKIHITTSVKGKVIEKLTCEDLIEEKKEIKTYTLESCVNNNNEKLAEVALFSFHAK